VGIGDNAAAAAYGLVTAGSTTSGANQYSIAATNALSGTTWSSSFLSQLSIPTATTVTNAAGLRIVNPTVSGTGAITSSHGIYIDDLTTGTNDFGITSLVSSGTNKWNIYASGTAANYFAGNVLVGGTTVNAKFSLESSLTASDGFCVKNTVTQSGTQYFVAFRNSANSIAGSIAHTGTTTVAYNTSSDYRLKENIAPMTGALSKVALLKPVTYKWKVDGSDGQGFIAHELAEVEAGCVTGEKDAVDADGNPVYQGIDTSFLVATLTAAIQEMKAIIDTQASTITTLTDRITALENA
jgi:hypothetical protein